MGCHKGTTDPLGNLANAALRTLRSQAHRVFDPLWQGGTLTRTEAYRWLSREMGLLVKHTHIGMFDTAQCLKVFDLMAERTDVKRKSRPVGAIGWED